MIRKFFAPLFMTLFVLIINAGGAEPQENEYKEYRPAGTKLELLQISFDQKQVEFTAKDGDRFRHTSFNLKDIDVSGRRVVADDDIIFDGSDFQIEGYHVALSSIDQALVDKYRDHTVLTFYAFKGDANRAARIRKGNRIYGCQNVVVEEDEFVRGMVLAVCGSVDIYGEINQDVISLFGDISVAPEAVVRGDVVTLTGHANVTRDATVYGEVFVGGQDRRHRRIHWYADSERTGVSERFAYNRVDGARPGISFRFADPQRMQPSAELSLDYAFESKRWRFAIGVEQPLMKRPQLSVGGDYYRRLASEDDWLLDNTENTVFALLATEDFKDYYEADGASLYARFTPIPRLEIEGRYRYEETNWLKAQPHLFSLFGGDKLFSQNYSTVPEAYRTLGIAELDSAKNGALFLNVKYDNRRKDEPYQRSAIIASASVEWSSADWGSDFDYRRYMLQATRYQKVHRRAMLIGRFVYGGSDGYLPMYKRFFVGGLGTLRGYYHKEFMGSRFWMTNLEYRFALPRTDFAVALLWDAAQISNSAELTDSDEVKHSLGVAAYFGEDLRISLARRLDRSFDTDPKIYVRLTHPF